MTDSTIPQPSPAALAFAREAEARYAGSLGSWYVDALARLFDQHREKDRVRLVEANNEMLERARKAEGDLTAANNVIVELSATLADLRSRHGADAQNEREMWGDAGRPR